MPGFPNRASRADYGPEPVNAHPVVDPARELDGETVGRLMFHQLAGLGVTAVVAWLLTPGTGATPAITARAEAWNPNAETGAPYTAPVVTRTGAGEYTIDYPATQPDNTGTLYALNFKAARAAVQAAGNHTAVAWVSGAAQVKVQTRTAGALADLAFLVEVL